MASRHPGHYSAVTRGNSGGVIHTEVEQNKSYELERYIMSLLFKNDKLSLIKDIFFECRLQGERWPRNKKITNLVFISFLIGAVFDGYI